MFGSRPLYIVFSITHSLWKCGLYHVSCSISNWSEITKGLCGIFVGFGIILVAR